MTSTLRGTLVGSLLTFALILNAGCQNSTNDLEESANTSAANGERQGTHQPPRADLQQITLEVTGMS